jgi:predicted RNA methylase
VEFYTSIAPYYDDIFGLEESQKIFIKNNMGDTAGTFIDAGSGSGNLSLAISAIADNVIGIEYDPRLVEAANSKIGIRTNISFLQGDITDNRKYASSPDRSGSDR